MQLVDELLCSLHGQVIVDDGEDDATKLSLRRLLTRLTASHRTDYSHFCDPVPVALLSTNLFSLTSSACCSAVFGAAVSLLLRLFVSLFFFDVYTNHM